jgi:hypothetical protein
MDHRLTDAERLRRAESADRARDAYSRKAAEQRATDPAQVAKAVRTVVAAAPRLTSEQVEQIRRLLPAPELDHADPAA